MAQAIVTIKVMPENPEINLDELENKVKDAIKEFIQEDSDMKTEIEPVAFGLKALKIIFVMEESLGSPDSMAEKVENFEEVASAEIVDVRRALG
jgi:elongation factor 1-beta|tara:strand:- start:665 stop:946 length:282 start_codon:yes stop_codon:yes gene_type:complete